MKLEIISRIPEDPRPTPLLFVHGAWHAAWCWEENFLPFFADKGYAAHAVSLRGHGRSPNPKSLRRTSTNDYVHDVAEAAQSLSAPPVVIGHSMGGFVVQKYLERYHVPGAVLLAAAPPRPILGTTWRVARQAFVPFLKANLQMNLYPVVETPELARTFLLSANVEDDVLEALHGRLQAESYRAYLEMLGLSLPHPKRVKAPVLVLGAANDFLFHPGDIEATARAYHTEAHIFPDMAHNMMVEPGWQEVAAVISDWLDEIIND